MEDLDITSLSDDQQVALANVAVFLDESNDEQVIAVTGKAGSGKTTLLSKVEKGLKTGVQVGDIKLPELPVIVAAPTNKAAAVLRKKGVEATTVHKVLYRPRMNPLYTQLKNWIEGKEGVACPSLEQLNEISKKVKISEVSLERAKKFYAETQSVSGAIGVTGMDGTDFIQGWDTQGGDSEVGFQDLFLVIVDEASMVTDKMFEDLKKRVEKIIFFGDPAQLAPVDGSADPKKKNEMVFKKVAPELITHLNRIHRQDENNPILDIAHAIGEPGFTHTKFEKMIHEAAEKDERIKVTNSVNIDLMLESPVLTWRNKIRRKLIDLFRKTHGLKPSTLALGEPLICDGLEIDRDRDLRRMLSHKGVIKGTPAFYCGTNDNFTTELLMPDAENPRVTVPSIIKIEKDGQKYPNVIKPTPQEGAVFLHAAAITIHKAQGSQWPTVQVIASDIEAAANSQFVEARVPLWKRLAYVAITRAEENLIWVDGFKATKPTRTLDQFYNESILPRRKMFEPEETKDDGSADEEPDAF